MKILAVLAVLLGVMALLKAPADNDIQETSHKALAMNYANYRNAVFLYVQAHKGFSGDIPLSSLSLPESWRMLRTWKARVHDGCCYVFGEATPEEGEAVRKFFQGSFAVGLASGGRLVPALAPHPVPIPSFVPEGSLVSVMEVSS